MSMTLPASTLLASIHACTHCRASLPVPPRPVVQFSASARILIIGQAPGSRVHASGVPWDDDSGARLRTWMGIDDADFYDPRKIALMPMGFCYPGKGSSGDLPPRPECAPKWHGPVLSVLTQTRLTLLVGTYAQAHYLPETRRWTLLSRVQRFHEFGPATIPLPHPSWRSVAWQRRHPWFEQRLLPDLQAMVRTALR